MDIYVVEYANIKRAEMALWLLLSEKSASLIPLNGSFTIVSGGVKCISDEVAVLALPGSKASPVLVRKTVTPQKASEAVCVTPFVERRDNLFYQLVLLCQAKFANSKNQFVLECASEGCTLAISAEENTGDLTYVVKAPAGDAFLSSSKPLKELLQECKSLRSFSFTTNTESCDKTIKVRRGQIEIYREISHYLNRTLMFSAVDLDGRLKATVCLSAKGCCEYRSNKAGNKRFYKVPFTRANISPASTLCAIDFPIDQLISATSVPALVRGETGARNN